MPGRSKNCKAIHQGGTEMCCGRCDFVWDADDQDPPKCLTKTQINRKRGRAHLKRIRQALDEKP